MRKNIILTALLLTAGSLTLSRAQTWSVEQITENTESDQYPFVTRVPLGFTIVYAHNDGDQEAFVASNVSGSWTSSRITDNSTSDVGLDIASWPGKKDVHIALWWTDTPDWEISYCGGNPSDWNIQRVTDDANADAWPSIEIDQNGFVHMVFQKNTGGDNEIFYANNKTGDWNVEQVTDNGVEDLVPWMALDSDGNPHIVYTDISNLFYTKKTAGIWTTPVSIMSGLGTNSYPYLVLDREDYAHISYAKNDGIDYEIYYANNVTGDWQESKVTTNDYDDAYPTLFVNPDGKIHIAYQAIEAADKEIFYANNVGGVWDIGRVTDNSVHDEVILGRFFIPDGQGFGYIFFWNSSDGDNEIYMARSDTPIMEGIEEIEQMPNPVSISLDRGVFSLASTVGYSVHQAGNVSVKVYDASGSLAKTLVYGSQSQGEHTVTWNGITDQGVKAAPGIYFFRLVAAGETASVKAVLK